MWLSIVCDKHCLLIKPPDRLLYTLSQCTMYMYLSKFGTDFDVSLKYYSSTSLLCPPNMYVLLQLLSDSILCKPIQHQINQGLALQPCRLPLDLKSSGAPFVARFSPVPAHRRPSADSEASFHTAVQLRSEPEYPLDTVNLLNRILSNNKRNQHMVKGEPILDSY